MENHEVNCFCRNIMLLILKISLILNHFTRINHAQSDPGSPAVKNNQYLIYVLFCFTRNVEDPNLDPNGQIQNHSSLSWKFNVRISESPSWNFDVLFLLHDIYHKHRGASENHELNPSRRTYSLNIRRVPRVFPFDGH